MDNKDLISLGLGHREPLLKLNANITDNRVLSHVVTSVTPQPMMTNAQPRAELTSADPFFGDPGSDSLGDAGCDTFDPGDPGDPFDNPGDATDPGSDPSDPFSDPGSDIFDPGGDPGGGRDYFGW
jgi:hypothetical protein